MLFLLNESWCVYVYDLVTFFFAVLLIWLLSSSLILRGYVAQHREIPFWHFSEID